MIVFIVSLGVDGVIVTPWKPGTLTYPLGLGLTAASGALVGALSGSPLSDMEGRAARSLARFRGVHVASFAVLGVLLAAACGAGQTEFGSVSFARNAFGFTGISLLSAVAGGPRLSWIIPLLWVSLPPFLFSNRVDDALGIVTFYAQPASNPNSLAFAIVIGAVGVAAAIVIPPRERLRGLAS